MKRKTILLAIAACLIWSTAFAGIKIALEYTKPLFTAGFRFFISGLILIPFCCRNYIRTIKKQVKTILTVSLFQTVLLYALFFLGMEKIPGAIGAVIVGSSPLTAALTAHVMLKNDRLDIRKFIKILLGIGGVAIISLSRNPLTAAGFDEMLGILLLLVGSVCSALGNIIVLKNKKDINPVILNSAQLGIGGLFLILISLPIEGIPTLSHPPRFFAAILWLALISASGFSIWFYLLKQPGVKVSEINVWKFLIPVSGAALSWLLLPEESPRGITIVGMCIVSASVFIFFNPFRKKIHIKTPAKPGRRGFKNPGDKQMPPPDA